MPNAGVFFQHPSDQTGQKHKKLLCRRWIFLGLQQSEALYTKITIAVVSGRTLPHKSNIANHKDSQMFPCHAIAIESPLGPSSFSGWEDALAAVESALQETWKQERSTR